jgi:hypothetical protein
MAKMKATPKSYSEAAALLNGREQVKLGNNTWLERLEGLQFIGVRLHNTYIVRFHYNGKVTLHTGGYHTVTTKERMNQFIYGRVYQKAYDWYFYVNRGTLAGEVTVIFSEGMEVQP